MFRRGSKRKQTALKLLGLLALGAVVISILPDCYQTLEKECLPPSANKDMEAQEGTHRDN
jgi:hypothetical protein